MNYKKYIFLLLIGLSIHQYNIAAQSYPTSATTGNIVSKDDSIYYQKLGGFLGFGTIAALFLFNNRQDILNGVYNMPTMGAITVGSILFAGYTKYENLKLETQLNQKNIDYTKLMMRIKAVEVSRTGSSRLAVPS